MTDDLQPELDLHADYGWMHVMRSRIMQGLIAEIGETAWGVYTVIKAHANHHNGRAAPSQGRIAELIGKSTETVSRSTSILERAGLLKKTKRGRLTEYTLLEAAPITNKQTGDAKGSADFDYVPAAFASQLVALKAFLIDGLPPGRGITLNLNVNLVQQGDHGVVNLQNISMGSAADSREDVQILVQAVTKKLKLLN